jgi:hypothetical protein
MFVWGGKRGEYTELVSDDGTGHGTDCQTAGGTHQHAAAALLVLVLAAVVIPATVRAGMAAVARLGGTVGAAVAGGRGTVTTGGCAVPAAVIPLREVSRVVVAGSFPLRAAGGLVYIWALVSIPGTWRTITLTGNLQYQRWYSSSQRGVQPEGIGGLSAGGVYGGGGRGPVSGGKGYVSRGGGGGGEE